MFGAVLDRPGPIEGSPLAFRGLAEPEPGDDEVLLSVLACGVCRSNLHMIEGEWLPSTPAKLPIVPGHEVVGRVVAVGTGVVGLSVGERVGVQPLWGSCGHCTLCQGDSEHLCRSREITGETRDGGFAEMMLAKGSNVYSVPAGLSDTEAAPLFCPGVTAYGAVSKAELLPGSSVGVFGVGGVGHVVIQLALLAGADVVTFTNNPLHRDLARELGAAVDEQYQPGEETSVPEGVVDCAIVFAPSDYVVAAALRAVKPGGRVVLGVSQNIRRFPFGDGKSVIGSVLANQAETRELLALAASGSVRISQESFPMREANQVLTLLKQGKIRARAVLVP